MVSAATFMCYSVFPWGTSEMWSAHHLPRIVVRLRERWVYRSFSPLASPSSRKMTLWALPTHWTDCQWLRGSTQSQTSKISPYASLSWQEAGASPPWGVSTALLHVICYNLRCKGAYCHSVGGQQGICLMKWLHTAASRGPTVLSQSSKNVPVPPEGKGQLAPNMLSLVINTMKCKCYNAEDQIKATHFV